MYKKISFLTMLVFLIFISSCTVSKDNNIIQDKKKKKKRMIYTEEVGLPVKPNEEDIKKKSLYENPYYRSLTRGLAYFEIRNIASDYVDIITGEEICVAEVYLLDYFDKDIYALTDDGYENYLNYQDSFENRIQYLKVLLPKDLLSFFSVGGKYLSNLKLSKQIGLKYEEEILKCRAYDLSYEMTIVLPVENDILHLGNCNSEDKTLVRWDQSLFELNYWLEENEQLKNNPTIDNFISWVHKIENAKKEYLANLDHFE